MQVSHICVSKLTIIGSDDGLSPGQRQAIIWTNAGISLTWPIETKFYKILIKIYTFSFKKIHLKMSSRKWRLFCLGLNVLTVLWPSCIYWSEVGSGLLLYACYMLWESPSWKNGFQQKSCFNGTYEMVLKGQALSINFWWLLTLCSPVVPLETWSVLV